MKYLTKGLLKSAFLLTLLTGTTFGLSGINTASAFYISGDHYLATITDSHTFSSTITKVSGESLVVDSFGVQGGAIVGNPSLTVIGPTNVTLNVSVNQIKGKALVWVNIKNTVNNETKTYYFRILSSFNPFGATSLNSTVSGESANLNITDPEYDYITNPSNRNYVGIANNYTYLASDNGGSYTYSIKLSGGEYFLVKSTKQGEVINEYTIVFKDTSNATIANGSIASASIENIFVLGGRIYVTYQAKLFEAAVNAQGNLVISGGNIEIKDTGRVGSFKLLDGSITSTDIDVGGSKIIQKGKFLYYLNGTVLKVDYLKNSDYNASSRQNIVSVNVPVGTSGFYILDNNVILYSRAGAIGQVNTDFILYQFFQYLTVAEQTGNYDGNPLKPLNIDKTGVNSASYPINHLYSKSVAGVSYGSATTKLNTLGNLASVITPFTLGGVSGTEKYIPDSMITVSFSPNNIQKYTFNKTLRAYKISSLTSQIITTIGSNVGETLMSGSVPLMGYGVLMDNAETCNRTEDVPINTPITSFSKVFNVQDGNYCLYVNGYDIGGNTTPLQLIKLSGGDNVLVKSNKLELGEPEIQRNTISNELRNVDFYIFATRQLSSMTVNYITKSGTGVTKSLTGTGANRIQYISSDGNTFKYAFNTDATSLAKTTTFNITGVDYYGKTANLVYQYDLYKGYYQVVGLTQTNLGVSGDLGKTQSKKGFLYGLSSANSDNKDSVQTMFFFNKDSTASANLAIPTKMVSGVEVVDTDMLKFVIKDIRQRTKKTFVYDPSSPMVFANGYYYIYNGDLNLTSGLNYYGNGILVVSGKVRINGDITKNISNETSAYENKLRIFASDNIEIASTVKKIDSDLFTNKTASSYSKVDYDAVMTSLATPPPAEIPPIMGNIVDQVVIRNQPFTLNIASLVTATNGDTITSYSLAGTLPTGLSFNTTTGLLSGTPTQLGAFSFSATATDNDGVSYPDTFTINVTP